MRRITIKYAKPGMVLDQTVYDSFGNILVDKAKELDSGLIVSMKEKGVTEIFIRDWRAVDVLAAPLFSPQTEGVLAKAFRQLLLDSEGKQRLSIVNINQVHLAMLAMIRDMNLNMIGDINVSCSISPRDYLYLQPVKTAGLALALGHGLRLSPDELTGLGMAAVFKDIGLPKNIIENVDWIAEGSSPRMLNHPKVGYKLLNMHKLTSGDTAKAVLQHHEFWNGMGYPQGLKGKDISLFARIIAVADAFVDLLTDRPGRSKCLAHEAIEYIMAGGNDQFDPEIVELLVRRIPSYPAGISVKLSTGDRGIISDPKMGYIGRPVIRICHRPAQGTLKKPFDIDLTNPEYQRLLVTQVLEYD
jgi:HD-GYP domain-containing protein (c-di-GMP phosphodiesterase class II)